MLFAPSATLYEELPIDPDSSAITQCIHQQGKRWRCLAAAHYGLGVVPYSPLARGVLTGKYAVDAPPPNDSRAGRGDKRIQQTEWRPESLKIARSLAEYAARSGTTSVAFALAWVLGNRFVSATIAGPRTEAHWDSYVEALELKLGAEDEAFVDGLVPPGHVSTPGYTDPGYPIEGRQVT